MRSYTIFAGTANPVLARAIAADLDVPTGKCEVERFPDGELSVRLGESVRGLEVFVVQPTSPPVAETLMELVAFCDACRRAGAERTVAVIPYFGYARADRRTGGRVPIMARAVAEVLEASGVQQVVTVDLHAPQVEGFFRIPVENLTAVPLLGDTMADLVPPDTVVVAPDFGAVNRATRLAERLGFSVAILAKRRTSGREVEVRQVVGEVRDRRCLLLDDMISTGGTLLRGMEALRAAGAHPDFLVAATHGVFAEGALKKLKASGVNDVVVTDTIRLPAGSGPPPRRISVAPLLASALRRLAAGESLRDLV